MDTNLEPTLHDGNHYVLEGIGLSVVGEVAIIYMEDFQMKTKGPSFPELNDWREVSK